MRNARRRCCLLLGNLLLALKLFQQLWLDFRKSSFHTELYIFRNVDFDYLKYYNSGKETDGCMKLSTIIYLSTNYGWIASWISLHFRWFFTGVDNTSTTPTGWEGRGRAGSHEVASKGYVFIKTSQMASIGAIFTSTYHTKQLNPWPNSSASRVVNYSRLSACQEDM